VDAVSQRIVFSKNELKSLRELYKEHIISKSRYLEMQKQLSELSGNYGEYMANISKVKQTIAETEMEIINLKTENNNQVIKDLQEVQTKIVDLEERTRATGDILHRTIITAPQAGIINGLKFHTQGGVIPPNAEVMELIPQDDELIVEVKVNPQDIDVVAPDLIAKVHLAAYRSKIVPLLKGKVINISANSFEEPQTNTSYFLARIRIDGNELKHLQNVRLYPGMPVEAYIVTGSRTFFQYLFDPITVSVRRAIREE
jgi:HlyD family type I secretion membrane fusion protein